MGKNAYIGVSSVAKKIKNIYVGVGGVAKKVKKAYIGVGGVAKLWWSSEGTHDPKVLVRLAGTTTSISSRTARPYYSTDLGATWAAGATQKVSQLYYDNTNSRWMALPRYAYPKGDTPSSTPSQLSGLQSSDTMVAEVGGYLIGYASTVVVLYHMESGTRSTYTTDYGKPGVGGVIAYNGTNKIRYITLSENAEDDYNEWSAYRVELTIGSDHKISSITATYLTGGGSSSQNAQWKFYDVYHNGTAFVEWFAMGNSDSSYDYIDGFYYNGSSKSTDRGWQMVATDSYYYVIGMGTSGLKRYSKANPGSPTNIAYSMPNPNSTTYDDIIGNIVCDGTYIYYWYRSASSQDRNLYLYRRPLTASATATQIGSISTPTSGYPVSDIAYSTGVRTYT